MKNIKTLLLLMLAITVVLFAFASCGSEENGSETTTTAPNSTTTLPDGTTTEPDGTTKIPGGTTVKPEDATHTHVFKDATCTSPKTCECGGTYTEEVEKLGHIDENLDVSCDREGCTTKIAPTGDTTLSLFTANNLASKLSTSNKYS